jgi:hypothetical protein
MTQVKCIQDLRCVGKKKIHEGDVFELQPTVSTAYYKLFGTPREDVRVEQHTITDKHMASFEVINQ